MKGASLYLHVFTPILFVALAMFFLGIAGRAARHRRPFLLSQRWLFFLICVGFLPSIANPFLFHASRTPSSLLLMSWLNPAMFLCMLAFFWYQMQGYVVFAVTEESFRQAFHAAAAKLGYTVEESLASLRLQPGDIKVRANVQGWSGTGQLRADRQNRPVVASLAQEMNAHYAAHGGEANYVTVILYGVMGLFMIAMAVIMAVMRLGK